MPRPTTLLKPGEKYNRLTVIELNSIKKTPLKNGLFRNIEYYKCKCDCGSIVYVQKACLKNNHVQSCGCLNTEKHTKHNGRHTRLYKIWVGFKNRCFNKNADCYMRYGGRGITVCEEWKNDFQSFYNWAINNGYSDKLTIDRIDVNGNYEPNNCRWADKKQQNNNKRSNTLIEFNGEVKTLTPVQKSQEVAFSSIVFLWARKISQKVLLGG